MSTTFTEASTALNRLLERFRSETLSLEEAVALFEEGIRHIQTCQRTLNGIKGRVEALKGDLLGDGNGVAVVAFGNEAGEEASQADQANTTTQPNGVSPDRADFWLGDTLAADAVKALLMGLKKALALRTNGTPAVFARDNGTGVEGWLPLENGWLQVSTWDAEKRLRLLCHTEPKGQIAMDTLVQGVMELLPEATPA